MPVRNDPVSPVTPSPIDPTSLAGTPAPLPAAASPAPSTNVTVDAPTPAPAPRPAGAPVPARGGRPVLEAIPGLVAADGTLLPEVQGRNERVGKLLDLAAASAAGTQAPLAPVQNPKLVGAIARKLAQEHGALCAGVPSGTTGLAWRQARGGLLHLMVEAARRASALGAKAEVRGIVACLVETLRQEPCSPLRDFVFDQLLRHAEAKELPEVRLARETLYPSAPPSRGWGKVMRELRACDNEGSLVEDNIAWLKQDGYRHEVLEGGWHKLTRKKRHWARAHEVYIPPVDRDLKELRQHLGDPTSYQIITLCAHSGYGGLLDKLLEQGVAGSGKGQVFCAYQCWSMGNAEKLERVMPDVQYCGTTQTTSDDSDFLAHDYFVEGFATDDTWKSIRKKLMRCLETEFEGEQPKGYWNEHYVTPEKRDALRAKYNRDNDATPDAQDNFFNVVYPQQSEATGGYNPLVQQLPRFALDGRELTKSVQTLTLVASYDKLLPEPIATKLPWSSTSWKAGGFFTPAEGDLRAFDFVRDQDGSVQVRLSEHFAHTPHEDLARMLGLEAGFYLGKLAEQVVAAMSPEERQALPEAYRGGVSPKLRSALGLALLERMGEKLNGGSDGGGLDAPWVEDELLAARYGVSGIGLEALRGRIDALVGGHGDYLPEHFEALRAQLEQLPGMEAWCDRAPTAVGTAQTIATEITLDLYESAAGTQAKLGQALSEAGIAGQVVRYEPRYWDDDVAQALLVTVVADGRRSLASVLVQHKKVEAVQLLPVDVEANLDASARQCLPELAEKLRGPLPAVEAAYAAARGSGRSSVDALLEAMQALRAGVPAGETLPSPELSPLRANRCLDPDELERLLGAASAIMQPTPAPAPATPVS